MKVEKRHDGYFIAVHSTGPGRVFHSINDVLGRLFEDPVRVYTVAGSGFHDSAPGVVPVGTTLVPVSSLGLANFARALLDKGATMKDPGAKLPQY